MCHRFCDRTAILITPLRKLPSRIAVLVPKPIRMGSRWGLVISVVLATIPFVRGFSATHVFFVRDLGLYFWPRHLWFWRSMRSLDLPLWDPYAAGGQSAVADALNQFFLLPVAIVRVLAPAVVGFN